MPELSDIDCSELIETIGFVPDEKLCLTYVGLCQGINGNEDCLNILGDKNTKKLMKEIEKEFGRTHERNRKGVWQARYCCGNYKAVVVLKLNGQILKV